MTIKLRDYIEDPSNVFTEEDINILEQHIISNRFQELEIEIFQLREENRKLDADNYHLKRQLLNKNDEIRNQRKIIDKLSKRLNSKQTPRYRNQKGDRR